MSRSSTILRVFIASPGDLSEERELFQEVIKDLNIVWSKNQGLILEPVMWETHSYPGVSTDAQAVINEQISDDYDIFVGVLGTRFGTPTNRASSGTEEEFERAFTKWQVNRNSIRLMIYFKNAQVFSDEIDLEQLGKVKDFRKKLGKEKGVLYHSFTKAKDFEGLLRMHLSRQVQEWGNSWGNLQIEAKHEETTHSTNQIEVFEDNLLEEGFLDLVENGVDEFRRVTESIQRMAQINKDFTERIKIRTDEIKEKQKISDSKNNLYVYKESANKVAGDLEDLIKLLEVEIPIYGEGLTKGLSAQGKAFAMLSSFPVDNTEIVIRSIESLSQLRQKMISNKTAQLGLRDSIAKTPPLTTQLNRAKRRAIEIFEKYIQELDRGLALASEVEKSLQGLLKSQTN